MFGFLEDAYVGGIVGDEVAYVSKGEDGVVVFVISSWVEPKKRRKKKRKRKQRTCEMFVDERRKG